MKNIAFSLAIAIALLGCKSKEPAAAPTAGASATPVIVMTAASGKDAMTDIASAFRARTGIQVTVATGASNVLASQIINGAPASLFLSANPEWANAIQEKGLAARVQPLLTNDLVMIVPHGNPGYVKTPADLLEAPVKKVALAGPNVPAGKYAEQALTAEKLYDALNSQGKIVRGQDVRVTESFVERGEAEAGVVYSTDALRSTQVEVVYTFDPATHDTIVYPLVLLKSAEKEEAAVQFFEYLMSPEAEKIFARYGFVRLKQ